GMERTLVNSGDLYQLSEELDWQVCRVPRIPNFKPVKKRSFRLSWGSSIPNYFHGKQSSYIRKNRIRFAIECKSSVFLIEA
ncbi:hypothetical protein, partial [Ligilactobacillus ruminis]|uniref:hypothetical protein n=1 Tax=Ligilactobacillus ruminis TaxID=1623 RepID=UPI003F9AD16E